MHCCTTNSYSRHTVFQISCFRFFKDVPDSGMMVQRKDISKLLKVTYQVFKIEDILAMRWDFVQLLH